MSFSGLSSLGRTASPGSNPRLRPAAPAAGALVERGMEPWSLALPLKASTDFSDLCALHYLSKCAQAAGFSIFRDWSVPDRAKQPA
jgi:hypothetical protein